MGDGEVRVRELGEMCVAEISPYIPGLLACLNNWSDVGFGNFMESGVLSDVAESSGSHNMSPPQLIIPWGPSDRKGTVTKSQFVQLLEVVPSFDVPALKRFIHFFGMWSQDSSWWDYETADWEIRDAWREHICLPRLNPIYEAPLIGITIVFRKTGHCAPWKNPPEGYRYASRNEARAVALFYKIRMKEACLIWSEKNQCWMHTRAASMNRFYNGMTITEIFFDTEFFIPLVKL